MVLSRRGQTIMEYVVLISIISAAVMVMLPRVKRTTQSMIKIAADQIGDQKGADQNFNDAKRGFLVGTNTITRTFVNNLRQDMYGNVDQRIQESTGTDTTSLVNSGYSED